MTVQKSMAWFHFQIWQEIKKSVAETVHIISVEHFSVDEVHQLWSEDMAAEVINSTKWRQKLIKKSPLDFLHQEFYPLVSASA